MILLLRELLGVALFWALGVAIVRLFARGSSTPAKFLILFLGAGIGAGTSSIIWFLLYVVAHLKPIFPIAFEIGSLSAAIWAGHRIAERRKEQVVEPKSSDFPGSRRWPKLLFALLVVAPALSSAAYFCMFSWFVPYGEWDGWAIWNLHARVLFNAVHFWASEMAALGYAHPDYPLLEPLAIMRLWVLGGRESPLGSILIGFVFTFATAGVLFSAIALLKGWWQAVVGTVTLLGMSTFVHLGAAQYADVPLSFFLLSAVVLVACYTVSRNRYLIALAGLAGGFAAWTKNEGWLFTAALLFGYCLLVFRQEMKTGLRRDIQCFGVAFAIPALITVLATKMVGSPSDVLRWASKLDSWLRLLEWKRISLVLANFGSKLWSLDNWIINPILVLAAFALLVGVEPRAAIRRTGLIGFAAILLTLIGEIGIYVISEHDVIWYVNTSLQRLYLQLVPVFIFSFLMFCRSPFLSGRTEPNVV